MTTDTVILFLALLAVLAEVLVVAAVAVGHRSHAPAGWTRRVFLCCIDGDAHRQFSGE